MTLLLEYHQVVYNFVSPPLGLEIAKDGNGPLDMLQRWRCRKATDPRDKVYALMELSSTMPFPSVQSCDYTISEMVLFTKITFDLVGMERGLIPLVGIRQRFTSGLPSWALDLVGTPDVKRSNWWKNHSHRYPFFSADGGESVQFELLADGLTLALKGMFVDEVVSVGSVWSPKLERDTSDPEILETLESWEPLMQNYVYSNGLAEDYVNGDSWENALVEDSDG